MAVATFSFLKGGTKVKKKKSNTKAGGKTREVVFKNKERINARGGKKLGILNKGDNLSHARYSEARLDVRCISQRGENDEKNKCRGELLMVKVRKMWMILVEGEPVEEGESSKSDARP